MEIVVLNGARAKDARVDEATDLVHSTLSSLGHVTVYRLRDLDLADCLGCFGCWVKTPGECIIQDAAKNVSDKLRRSDLKVFLTPVVFGGYSYPLKKALDREVCSELLPFFLTVKGEIHHQPRYEKHASILVLGVLPKPDPESEALFRSLVVHNAVNIHAPTGTVGFIYQTDNPAQIEAKLKSLFIEAGIKNE
jgi:multimeric flavodoxin WrbA